MESLKLERVNTLSLIFNNLRTFKLFIMKTEIFEIDYSELGLSNNCVTFNSTKEIQKILANYFYSISGVCIITLNTGAANVYKFTFSCIGDDGTINAVSTQFPLEKEIVKSYIVNYAVELALAKRGA